MRVKCIKFLIQKLEIIIELQSKETVGHVLHFHLHRIQQNPQSQSFLSKLN